MNTEGKPSVSIRGENTTRSHHDFGRSGFAPEQMPMPPPAEIA